MNLCLKDKWHAFWCDPNGNAKLSHLFTHPVFWGVLALKLIVGSLLASEYLSDLFLPFGDQFIAHPLANPYAVFWAADNGAAFPYPAFMLYVFTSVKFLLTWLTGHAFTGFGALLLYRLPLLGADLLILATLVRWLPNKILSVLYLYWASPVLFYISYVHGQLDVIPLALLFLSLHAMFKENKVLAGVFFGLGLAAKTHLVVCFPFFLIYLWRRQENVQALVAFSAAALVAFLVPNLPYLASDAFIQMVFLNAAQKKLALATFSFSPHADYYIVLGAYILLVFVALRINSQNRDVFLMFLGFSFGVLLFFIAPMQGWYYWAVPFFAYFFAKATRHQTYLFLLLQALYLAYFVLVPASDLHQIFAFLAPSYAQEPNLYEQIKQAGLAPDFLLNVVYTLLQTVLALTCAWIYRRGVRSYQKHKLTSQSFLIGISGDSGSGKSTLADAISSLFAPSNVTVICGDDMHKWQRGHSKWQEMTHLDPRANELHQELNYIVALRQHRTIKRRHYDHNTGKFTQEIDIRPKPIVIFEGLHTFYLKPARAMIDLKIFMKPDENLLLQRKIERDMSKRGYTLKKILDSLALRKNDSEKYIKTQEAAADIVVAVKLDKDAPHEGAAREASTWLSLTTSNAYYFDPLLEEIGAVLGADLQHSYDAEDRQVIAFRRPVPLETLHQMCEKYLPGFQELGIYAPGWQEGFNGLLQLFIAWCVFADFRRG